MSAEPPVTRSAVTTGSNPTDRDRVDDPAVPPGDERLTAAFRRYDAAYRNARPGTLAAAELARARLDLLMLLLDAGEELPADLTTQMGRDADALLVQTPPLAYPES